MKKIILFVFVFLFSFILYRMNNYTPSWNIIKIKIDNNKYINTIQNIRDSIIYVAGGTLSDGTMDIRKSHPFVLKTSDLGKTWKNEKLILDCNEVEELTYNSDFIFMQCFKYIENIGRTFVYFKYNIEKKEWEKIDMPADKECFRLYVANPNKYIANVTKNQFGLTFLKTTDGGKTWEEKLIFMPNKRDYFFDKLLADDKLWGVRRSAADYKKETLLYINTDTWRLGKEILLERGDNVVEMKSFGKKVYVLIKTKNKGYIKRVNEDLNALETVSEFDLSNDDIAPIHFYLYKDYQIIVAIDMNKYLPDHYLLYKKGNSTTWKKEKFPEHIYPYISFDNGRLMGVFNKDKIFYKDFD